MKKSIEFKKNKRNALVNISNIHNGGALQVAISFVSELILFEDVDERIKILISDEVLSGLSQKKLAESKWDIEVFNTYGLSTIWSSLNELQEHYDVVFTLYGPKYTLFKSKIDIVGFAQLWILEFDNPITRKLSLFSRYKLKFEFAFKKWFFKRADHFIVELEHVKHSLCHQGLFPQKPISVVHNTLSNLYLDSSLWQPLDLERSKDEIAIGFVTRDYSHKNIQILPSVAKILREKYKIPVMFYLTLNDDEWKNYSDDFKNYGITVGPLSVYQCPTFYQQMDAVIFPSLLECFSATPLEALFMKKPLFASDRSFVKDVCQEHATYFDPLDVFDISKVISDYFLFNPKTVFELDMAKNHVLNFSNATNRAIDYLKIIQQNLQS